MTTDKYPVSLVSIINPFTGEPYRNEEGKTYKVGTVEELNFFRIMTEKKNSRVPVKLYFNNEGEYNQWKNLKISKKNK